MQALGLIETKGLLAAIECADAMLKAAEVHLLEKTYVGGGLVTVTIEGDVAAVKASVDAGGAAVRQLNSTLLISEHVIPRPHQDLDQLFQSEASEEKLEEALEEASEGKPEESLEEIPEESPEENLKLDFDPAGELHKEAVDQLAAEEGPDAALAVLTELKVVKLRNLAREYKDFGIAGRMISKADKQIILAEFKKYYEKN